MSKKLTLNPENMAKFASANSVRLYLGGDILIDKGHVESPVYEDFYKYDTVAETVPAFVSQFLEKSDTEIFVVATDQRNLVELDGFTELEGDCSIRARDINEEVYAFEVLDN